MSDNALSVFGPEGRLICSEQRGKQPKDQLPQTEEPPPPVAVVICNFPTLGQGPIKVGLDIQNHLTAAEEAAVLKMMTKIRRATPFFPAEPASVVLFPLIAFSSLVLPTYTGFLQQKQRKVPGTLLCFPYAPSRSMLTVRRAER